MTTETLDRYREMLREPGDDGAWVIARDLLDEVDRLRAGTEALAEDLHVLSHTTRCTGAMCDGCQAGRIEYRARAMLNPTKGENDE